MIETDKLRALIDVLIEKDVAEFEHEDENARIKIVRGRIAAPGPVMLQHGAPTHAAVPAATTRSGRPI